MSKFSIEIQIKNLDKIRELFDGVLTSRLRIAFKEKLDESYTVIKSQLAQYPAERPGQKYVRTGLLGRAWEDAKPAYAGSNGFSILATYTNMAGSTKVPYASYVQGTPQAWMHAGRWQSAEQILNDNQDMIAQKLSDAAETYLSEILGS